MAKRIRLDETEDRQPDLNNSLEEVLEDPEENSCPHCEYKSTEKDDLKYHIENSHLFNKDLIKNLKEDLLTSVKSEVLGPFQIEVISSIKTILVAETQKSMIQLKIMIIIPVSLILSCILSCVLSCV